MKSNKIDSLMRFN